ncbi:valine--tRNA ligase [Streptobacillus moniliformis]|uniref:Valine--tRNA ligase n=2 Tax=Streptobacillus moniliformis TaxID=34105 RepID=D1AWP5_STRM9|nr:valine--tRNA ligase [Streptobacillus moniliformis]ACZ00721.1 valyl-tRNA synthetase [Streptobacillus moniliformis DSM 12112]AVL42883.1 valine--tRNA ligase [Streptobacillus moniliformis]SQA14150.1 Valine--tRNA ligase [Streptobacillus moniliformis]
MDKYNPLDIEQKWYKIWEENGYFKPSKDDKKPAYTIVIPPPNVTGVLHMGHVLNNTIQDVVIRYKRMKGYDTLWQTGTDHAGIATQNVVERKLAESNLRKEDLGREEFIKKVWEWKEKHGGIITKQQRRIGNSVDWERERFTMDEGLSEAVKEVFVTLYNQGLIYKGEYMVNWCPRCTTALADDEINHIDKEGNIWEIKYPLKDEEGYLIVATTRPETMLGDTGIAVNPEDERYKHLIGKMAILPLMNREIPIVADNYVDMEFGTGVVKMTPAHDPNDFEVSKRTGLEIINVFTKDAKINELGGKYQGMDRFEARKAVLKDLEEEGLLVNVKKHNHAVGHCYRCKTIVEPRISDQWFVKMQPLAKRALDVVKNGEVKLTPKRMEKRYYNWLENIRDWTISRQIWWGHRIPAYYTPNNELIVAKNIEEAKKICVEKFGEELPLREETDVLDTWFSSALWPFSTMGWPEKTRDLERYFPTDLLVTGDDIIFFWVARMIMMSLHFLDTIPFKEVYFTGIIRDEIGRKMSKSLGNAPDTLAILDKYGSDAVRFSFMYNTSQGQDILFSEKLIEMGHTFANKIWNASKFVISNLEGFKEDISILDLDFKLEDQWILSKLQLASRNINKEMEEYNIDTSAKIAYEFFRNDFCDWYLEIAKTRIYGVDENDIDRQTAQWILRHVLDNGLRLLHPFMPFVTEEIWQKIKSYGESIMLVEYPEEDKGLLNLEVIKEFDYLKEVVSSIRNIRAENNISPAKKIEIIIDSEDENEKNLLLNNLKVLEKLANVESIVILTEIPKMAGFRIVGNTKVYVSLCGLIDVSKEIEKLNKDIEKVKKELERTLSKLSNEAFIMKAPKAVIDKENSIKNELERKLEKLCKSMDLYKN